MLIHPTSPTQESGGSKAPSTQNTPPKVPIINLNGVANVQTSSSTPYGLVLNCKLYGENYNFLKSMTQTMIFADLNGNVSLSIEGTPVNWYSNNNGYNGGQFIITSTDIKKLISGIEYKVSIKFTVDDNVYIQALSPNGVNISGNVLGLNVSTINNQLVIELIN